LAGLTTDSLSSHSAIPLPHEQAFSGSLHRFDNLSEGFDLSVELYDGALILKDKRSLKENLLGVEEALAFKPG
jgi:hypothetical protein